MHNPPLKLIGAIEKKAFIQIPTKPKLTRWPWSNRNSKKKIKKLSYIQSDYAKVLFQSNLAIMTSSNHSHYVLERMWSKCSFFWMKNIYSAPEQYPRKKLGTELDILKVIIHIVPIYLKMECNQISNVCNTNQPMKNTYWAIATETYRFEWILVFLGSEMKPTQGWIDFEEDNVF